MSEQQLHIADPGQDPQVPTYAQNMELLGQKMREAGESVSDSRMLDAYMAADDYAEGHDRLADNPHIQELSGADKKLFALAANEKQAHADRITGDGAYQKRLDKIATGVRKTIDDEIEERMNDTLAFWGGDNTGGDGGNGGNTPPTGGEGGGEGGDGGEPEPITITPEHQEALGLLEAAREKLARVRAEREARTVHRRGGKRGKKALEAALAEYEEAKLTAGLHGIEALQTAENYDEANLDGLVNIAVLTESATLTHRQFEIEVENTQNKRLNRFYSYWARHSQARLFSKQGVKDALAKSVALAPIGIAIGIVAAPAVATAGAFAGGVVAATRVSRGLMGAKVNKEAQAGSVAAEKATERLTRINQAIAEASLAGAVVEQETVSDIYRADTKEAVNKNRKRAVIAGVAAAAIGGATSMALEHFGWDHAFHHGNGNGNAEAQPSGGGNTQPAPAGGNAQPTTGGDVRPTGPNGQYLTDEQIKIFNSDEFKRMVTEGNKVHAQVNAEYPLPAKSWIFNDRLITVLEAQRNSIADQRVVNLLEYAALQDRLAQAASEVAPHAA